MNEDSEIGERLLKKQNQYYPDCPGCKVDLKKQSQSGFSYLDVFRIWIVVLANAMPISSLFPFLYFMIRDFHIAEREEDIGYYAGYVGAAFMLGRALTSVFWGIMADRYGRKPVIIIGTVTVVFCNTLFGLSVNYWMAIITRFLLGSLNGLLGPIKAYSAEIFPDEYQALGMSTISTAWGTGLVIGPALGGFFAQPAEKYPNIFPKNSLFGRFPYFLPCLCISILAAIVMVICFWLPVVDLDSPLGEEIFLNYTFFLFSLNLYFKSLETLHKHGGKKRSDIDTCEAMETASCVINKNESSREKTEEKQKSKRSLLLNWPLMSSIIVYCVISLHGMAYAEIFPLWAVSPQKFGGLSYSTEMVGEVLAISGFSLLVFQMFLYPYLEKFFGTVLVCRLSGALTIPLLASFPYISLLSGLTLFLVLNVASIVKYFLAASCVTSLFIMQNRAVSQEQRGAANGISMTLMSLFKAAGPAGGGALFSWAETRQDASFLPGTQMVFFMLNVVEAIGVLMTFKPFLATPP